MGCGTSVDTLTAEENADSAKSITVELKTYLHCDACERKVCRTIMNLEGVESVKVDREQNKFTVTGDFKTDELQKKIKKKTGKRAEILVPEEIEEEIKGEEPHAPCDDLVQGQEMLVVRDYGNGRAEKWYVYQHNGNRWPEVWDVRCNYGHSGPEGWDAHRNYENTLWPERWDTNYFNDENTQGCVVM